MAKKAISQGADYGAFGSFFKSKTKKTAYKASLSLLKNMRKNKKITKVAIGGIDNYNYTKILLNGADYIAISGHIWKSFELHDTVGKATAAPTGFHEVSRYALDPPGPELLFAPGLGF